ncbi:Uncharacterized protein Adt_46411 [Abeliophyllum distichum]|uniref:Uncharacterized protein n=1 Tax=Abeliophyllum distichum TaxID=126358 RepID=A0ABD1P109_9LAMI
MEKPCFNCKERISEASSIDMCVQGMHWRILYNLQANMPHSFKELVTRAHDLEIQITRYESYLPCDLREKKDLKKEIKRDGKSGLTLEAWSTKVQSIDEVSSEEIRRHGLS